MRVCTIDCGHWRLLSSDVARARTRVTIASDQRRRPRAMWRRRTNAGEHTERRATTMSDGRVDAAAGRHALNKGGARCRSREKKRFPSSSPPPPTYRRRRRRTRGHGVLYSAISWDGNGTVWGFRIGTLRPVGARRCYYYFSCLGNRSNHPPTPPKS